MSSPPPTRQQQQERLAELQQEQAVLQAQLQVQQFAADYPLILEYPAKIQSTNDNNTRPLRTDAEFLQHRLLESGVLYDIPVSVQESLQATSRFVDQLQATGCYNAVQVQLGCGGNGNNEASQQDDDPSSSSNNARRTRLHVKLDEANWYHLKAGGGLSAHGSSSSSILGSSDSSSTLLQPHAEVSVGLRNLAGVCDTTHLQYTLDAQTYTPTLRLQHKRPLYAAMPSAVLGDWLLTQANGSQYQLTATAQLETLDFQSTRSYQEHQRSIKLRAYTTTGSTTTSSASSSSALEWTLLHRDVIPRRHATLPFAFQASPEIVSQARPTVKHSIVWDWKSPTELVDHPLQPTYGLQAQVQTEVALPPGDVGFWKQTAAVSIHQPILIDATTNLTTLGLHAATSMGYLHNLSFGGLTRPATVSDRFYVGGPLQLRGFSPAGIGPRAFKAKQHSSDGPGDALGGDFFYTATLMASYANASMASPAYNARVFGFCTVGTCVGSLQCSSPWQVLASSRASVGVGLSTLMLGPRLEMTYAWPIRSGPRDVTRRFQFGMGFTFG
jgi:outer membrane protein assembly factor BamA